MSDAGVPDIENKWWFNSKTGGVEKGFVSPSHIRIGPFDTREEAEHALDKIRENSERWAAADAADD